MCKLSVTLLVLFMAVGATNPAPAAEIPRLNVRANMIPATRGSFAVIGEIGIGDHLTMGPTLGLGPVYFIGVTSGGFNAGVRLSVSPFNKRLTSGAHFSIGADFIASTYKSPEYTSSGYGGVAYGMGGYTHYLDNGFNFGGNLGLAFSRVEGKNSYDSGRNIWGGLGSVIELNAGYAF